MATPIINTNLGKVVTATGNIADDLSTLRPLLRNMLFSAYATDKIENAPIASFPDGADGVPVKSATFAITPVQDLHGYDAPWPAGGGKNKLPLDLSTLKSMNSEGTWNGNVYTHSGLTFTVLTNDSGAITGINVNGTASANETFWVKGSTTGALAIADGTSVVLSGCPTGGSWGSTNTYALRLVKDDYSNAVNDIGNGATMTYDSTWTRLYIDIRSGVSFSNKVFKPMVCLATATDPKVFAPYSNVCPISGFTGAEITDAGKNLFDKNAVVNDKRLSTTTGLEESVAGFCVSDYIPVSAGQTIFIPNSGSSRRWFYDKNKTPKTYLNESADQAYTATENGYVRITLATAGGYAVDINTYQVEYSSTATAYEPYVGTTHEITWQDDAGTVYGGTLAYLGGDSWRLTKTMESVDMGTIGWILASTYFFANITAKKNGFNNFLCSIYKKSTAPGIGNLQDKSIVGETNGNAVLVKDSAYADAASLTTAVTGQQLVYELATPVVYDLTGEELATVLGDNNVFSNTGDVTELVYRADTALFVEKKLAE